MSRMWKVRLSPRVSDSFWPSATYRKSSNKPPRETCFSGFLGGGLGIYTLIHFRYCCSVWGSCDTVLRQKIEKLQNRAVRIIAFSPYNVCRRNNAVIVVYGHKNLIGC